MPVTAHMYITILKPIIGYLKKNVKSGTTRKLIKINEINYIIIVFKNLILNKIEFKQIFDQIINQHFQEKIKLI